MNTGLAFAENHLNAKRFRLSVAAFLNFFLIYSDMSAMLEEWGYPGLEPIIVTVMSMAYLFIQLFFIMTLNRNRLLMQAQTDE